MELVERDRMSMLYIVRLFHTAIKSAVLNDVQGVLLR